MKFCHPEFGCDCAEDLARLARVAAAALALLERDPIGVAATERWTAVRDDDLEALRAALGPAGALGPPGGALSFSEASVAAEALGAGCLLRRDHDRRL